MQPGSRSELRVFISSTFRDLHDEREHLIKKIFPEIRAICRERGVEFTDIDLRWGLTEEQAALGQIIRTCLEEIDQCRPYFIGIVGSRYGWVPEYHEIQMDYSLMQKYPWIEDAAINGDSILEMEFIHGVFNTHSTDVNDCALFYVREPDASDIDDPVRLNELVGKIRGSGHGVRDFADPERLGELVKADLVALIDRYWPLDQIPTPLELERRAHEAFASTRRRAYIANHAYLKNFELWIADCGLEEPDYSIRNPQSTIRNALVITAPSGMGKSSLVAYLVHHYQRRHPEGFVIAHYIGASNAAADQNDIIRHVMEEIREHFGLTEDIPSTPEKIEREFPMWLAKVQGKELLLVIDAVNQLEGASRSLAWLPRHIPSNIRLLISTTPEETLDRLRERNWPELTIRPLDGREREALIVRYLGEYHKGLAPPQVRRIAADEKASSPLFLRTVAEELRLFGEFERLDEVIDGYLAAEGLNELFDCVLKRMESDFGVEPMRRLMSDIAAARRGLTETEILGITHLSRVQLSMLLHVLDYHLMRNGGRLTFFHAYLRQAVDRRYLPDEESRRVVHRGIADYFEAELPPDKAAEQDDVSTLSMNLAYELPYQLEAAGEPERLRDVLSNLALAERYCDDGNEYELLSYWSRSGGFEEMGQAYMIRLELLGLTSGDTIRRADVYAKLGTLLEKSSRYDLAEPLLRKSLEIRRALPEANDSDIARSLRALAVCLRNKGDLPTAESHFREAIELYQRSLGRTHSETTNAMNGLGALLWSKGDYVESEGVHREALAIQEEVWGVGHGETAKYLNNLAIVLELQEKYQEAESLYRQTLNIYQKVRADDQFGVAGVLNNLAVVLRKQQKYLETEELHQQARNVFERLFGREHVRTAGSIYNRGGVLEILGDYPAAEAHYREALFIHQRVLGKEHLMTIINQQALALLLHKQSKYLHAEELLVEILDQLCKSVGPEHDRVAQTMHHLGALHFDQRNLDKAHRYLSDALRVFEQNSQKHPQTADSLHYLGALYHRNGSLDLAIEMLERAVDLRTARLGAEHPDTNASRSLLLAIRLEMGE